PFPSTRLGDSDTRDSHDPGLRRRRLILGNCDDPEQQEKGCEGQGFGEEEGVEAFIFGRESASDTKLNPSPQHGILFRYQTLIFLLTMDYCTIIVCSTGRSYTTCGLIQIIVFVLC
ncbi:hypothetical protein T310_8852, partial [Rasamsonia emersonii CBS 393.64]